MKIYTYYSVSHKAKCFLAVVFSSKWKTFGSFFNHTNFFQNRLLFVFFPRNKRQNSQKLLNVEKIQSGPFETISKKMSAHVERNRSAAFLPRFFKGSSERRPRQDGWMKYVKRNGGKNLTSPSFQKGRLFLLWSVSKLKVIIFRRNFYLVIKNKSL